MVGALRRPGSARCWTSSRTTWPADPANRWWWDVLENGPASRYARFFDIDWDGAGDRSRFTVLVPVLGDQYGRVLEAGELGIGAARGDFRVRYHDMSCPCRRGRLGELLAAAARRGGSTIGGAGGGLGASPHALLTERPRSGRASDRDDRDRAAVGRAGAACWPGITEWRRPSTRRSRPSMRDVDRLDALLRRQNYRLAYWRTASEELDYRRFFNIETLVGVRVEDPDVFAATHQLMVELVREGSRRWPAGRSCGRAARPRGLPHRARPSRPAACTR